MVPDKDEQKNLRMLLKREVAKLEMEQAKNAGNTDDKHNPLWLQQIAASLRATGWTNDKIGSSIDLPNIRTGTIEKIAINPKLTIEENAQLYDKKAKKADTALLDQSSTKQLIAEKIKQLQSALDAVMQSEYDDPEHYNVAAENAFRLANDKMADSNESTKKTTRNVIQPPFRHFTIKTWHIFAGKSEVQNDELSIGFTQPNDLWFHVAGYAGSHLIIQRPLGTPEIEDAVIRNAASLAAWYSKSKNAPFTEVHYTEGRHVHKHKNAPAGEVYLSKYRSIKVKPLSPEQLFLSVQGCIL